MIRLFIFFYKTLVLFASHWGPKVSRFKFRSSKKKKQTAWAFCLNSNEPMELG